MIRARLAATAGLVIAAGLVVGGSSSASAQAPPSGPWNGPSVIRLVERARDLRQSTAVDPEFRSYQAEARGHVYFFVDRPDTATHVLVKGDQVALDVYWVAPNTTKQWIVGERDERVLPTSIRYHLDHLTVVQDDFGDFIRLGDGDEVEAVLHPIAPGAEGTYDYLLSDSLTLRYGAGEEIRVYEVQVRPKNLDRPGYVGTVFVDRDRAAIVRMNFSFTPESYVDDYLDYIRISLDNSLWLGRYWLPYRQEIEIRREIPYFDFMAGSTIRSQFDIRRYDFNVEIESRLLTGPKVRAVSPSQRGAFLFEDGIFDPLEEEGGLAPSPTMDEVREQVNEVVEDEVLSGLSPVRFHLSSLSDFARYNRAEGIFLGGGLTVRPIGELQLRPTAGYSFGRRRASGRLTVRGGSGPAGPNLDAYFDALGDIGRHPGAPPLENTISAASGEKDFLDPFFRRGAKLSLPTLFGRTGLSLTAEEHVGARDVVSGGSDTDFRPVRSIDEGRLFSASIVTDLGLPGDGSSRLELVGGLFDGEGFGSAHADVMWQLQDDEERWSGLLRATGGVTNRDAPAQALFLLGGRHTLPGHDYRLFVGSAYWLLRAEGTVPIKPPYLGLRAFAAAGATYLAGTETPVDWAARDSRGVRGSVGLGLSFGWDSMRFDVARAVGGTGWEAVFSVAPQFRSWL